MLPGLSSLSYLCARLRTSYENVRVVSLHGRQHNILPEVRATSRLFALVGGERGINDLCRTLTEGDLGHVSVYVGQRLGYPDERIVRGTAAELTDGVYAPLSVALIENPHPDAVVTPGLPDDAFLRSAEGMPLVPMTKSEVRAVCLSKLRLTERSVCWDIGAGTGSVSVEMALQAKQGLVCAVERREDAAALLGQTVIGLHWKTYRWSAAARRRPASVCQPPLTHSSAAVPAICTRSWRCCWQKSSCPHRGHGRFAGVRG